jgi:hypothetical protein
MSTNNNNDALEALLPAVEPPAAPAMTVPDLATPADATADPATTASDPVQQAADAHAAAALISAAVTAAVPAVPIGLVLPIPAASPIAAAPADDAPSLIEDDEQVREQERFNKFLTTTRHVVRSTYSQNLTFLVAAMRHLGNLKFSVSINVL